jgi:hypothetical protein
MLAGRVTMPNKPPRTDTNISIPKETLAALNARRDTLEALFGFKPTIAQTLAWLLAHTEDGK